MIGPDGLIWNSSTWHGDLYKKATELKSGIWDENTNGNTSGIMMKRYRELLSHHDIFLTDEAWEMIRDEYHDKLDDLLKADIDEVPWLKDVMAYDDYCRQVYGSKPKKPKRANNSCDIADYTGLWTIQPSENTTTEYHITSVNGTNFYTNFNTNYTS